jgi:hypothetical protein
VSLRKGPCDQHAGAGSCCSARCQATLTNTHDWTNSHLLGHSLHAILQDQACWRLLQVTDALLDLCQQRGVRLRTSTGVTAIRSQGGSVTGVELQDGSFLKADIVVANRQAAGCAVGSCCACGLCGLLPGSRTSTSYCRRLLV